MAGTELEGTLSDIENELSALEADTADTKYDDMSFISTASGFLIAHQIASGEHINYRELSCAVDAKALRYSHRPCKTLFPVAFLLLSIV